MKFRDFKEAAGVGIITKQNATKDVPVGGEYMNVKKLGLGKGKPKKHSKKVSGSKTNVLFNLGMAESIKEVSAKDLSKESEVYVDMDGVLADFFGAWKKLVGKDWREIKDLDSALQKIRDKDDFWLNIPITPNAMNLLGLIKQLKGKYNILSAPLPNDPNSEPHKRQWIEKNLSAFPPSKVIITSNKSVHATQPDGTPNILIDDFGKNIAKWEAAGGVGFKHKDHKFERTVKNLKAHMNKPVEEDTELNEWALPAFRVGMATMRFIGSFIRTNPKTSLLGFTIPWTGPVLATMFKGLTWLSRYSIPVALGVVALYGGKKLYNALKDKDPDTISEKELKQILKNYVPKSDKDLKSLSEAEMSKGSIKKIRKTVDKIDDKPKAKKSISKWAKGKFDDPKAAMFAIATNMRKRKEGKPIDPPGRESYARSELPQIRKKHLKNFPHAVENIAVSKIKPVQKERLQENYSKQLKNIMVGNYNPIVVDLDYKIINGHHRYDIIKMLKMENISVARLPFTLEQILHKMENFADGKKKGKSRPGRVKRSGASCKGSVTSLRAKAKKASGERAKMYHWCANMKGGKKKSESYTKEEFIKILSESTTQQLEEGIKDTLQKLPKNLISKVTPIIKKIPKTAKNLTLTAVLLGTMVNAVAAGDMAKVNTPLDKLNNMATMSTTMDTGNADVGPGHTMPDNIKVLKMPTPPEAPNSNTPDGTADDGTSTKTTKDGNRTVSSGAGTYTFSPDGKLLKYETPKIKGYSQTHDLVKKTVTVDANTPVTMTKDFGNLSKADREVLKKNDPNFDKSTTYVDQKATYDMSGKLISKDHTGVKSGAVEIGIGGDGNKSFKFDAGAGKVYKADTSDMPAAKKTLSKMQTDLNKAKDKSAPFQNKTT